MVLKARLQLKIMLSLLCIDKILYLDLNIVPAYFTIPIDVYLDYTPGWILCNVLWTLQSFQVLRNLQLCHKNLVEAYQRMSRVVL